MKYIYLLFIVMLLAGCNQNSIEINGEADGLTEGTITLKDGSGQTLDAVNIKDGKFHIGKTHLDYPDYGTLSFAQTGKDGIDFELYLEGVLYTVKIDKNNLPGYPHITTTSVIQNQLSAYRRVLDSVSYLANQKMKALDQQYKLAVKSVNNWGDSTTALANHTEAERAKLRDVGRQAVAAFISKYPQNEIAVHVMQSIDLDFNPIACYTLYQQLSPSQKNSEEGKAIGTKLNALIHLIPGQPAPAIAGTMPDGKVFNFKAMNKKLILVEFWKAANIHSRLNHQTMIKKPFAALQGNQLGIVSISMDKKRDWWLGSMRDDKLTWPQVSDLKGTDSPNFSNWGVEDLPAYYLVDGSGRMVDRNLMFEELNDLIEKYLKNH